MKLKLYPKSIFRIPQFPILADLSSEWMQLKKSISFASVDFFKIIQNVTYEEISSLPDEVRNAIWKYFNRSKFRSTPFGTFAGVTQIPLTSIKPQSSEHHSHIIIGSQNAHSFIDWKLTEKHKSNFTKLKCGDQLFTNSSFYKVGRSIRYLCLLNDAFTLSELEAEDRIESIMSLCAKPIDYANLLLDLSKTYSDEGYTTRLITELIKCQLLFVSRQPNIIGKDYFERIQFNKKVDHPPYLIAERPLIEGNLNVNLFRKLPALIEKLNGIQILAEQKMLSEFKNKFLKKFESAAVPLMIALDPELGIGYGNFEREADGSDMFDFLQSKNTHNGLQQQLQQSLCNIISKNDASQEPIDLQNLSINSYEQPLPLPNTFSLLGYQHGENVIIEKIGGISANVLSGRFSLVNREILNACRDIAVIEQKANQDVLFFDVAYCGEPNVDNVNRRQSIYPYQLSILNYDTSDDPMLINDLYVHVAGDEVILRSGRLNCRVIPRIASAYNYIRSDMSLFRFLSDLQYQNVQSSLHIDIVSLLPQRNYYPRLTFENFIISPAKWRLKNDLAKSSVTDMQNYLRSIKSPRYFRTGSSDQTLTFDSNNTFDLSQFLTMLATQKEMIIEEQFFDKDLPVKDRLNRPYVHQFILALTHDDCLYKDSKPRAVRALNVIAFPPGSQWIYFEIFLHPKRADTFLINFFKPILKKHLKCIHAFFFVRFDDNGSHLRLRVRVKDVSVVFPIISELADKLKNEISSGTVNSYRLNTYYPEVHRYGLSQMESVEKHFTKDADYVLGLLPLEFPVLAKYRLCSLLVEQLQKRMGISDSEMFSLLSNISHSFNKEHNIGPQQFKHMNAQYQEYKLTIRPYQNATQLKKFKAFVDSFITTLQLYPSGSKLSLFADLMHMHINRLFPIQQRSHEMMIYYFLHKDVLMVIKRKEQTKSTDNKFISDLTGA